jgi:hypothetical protein
MNPFSVLLAASIAAAPAPVTVEQLSDALVAYHASRVDLAHRGEDEPARIERIGWVAAGIVAACKEHPFDEKLGWTFNKCVALSSTAAKWESGLLREVHSGAKLGAAGERCLFQLHRSVSSVPDARYRVTPEELIATTGLDAEATARCAEAGVKSIGWHLHRCSLRGDDFVAPAELFAEYHHPSNNCVATLTKMNSDRARSYRALLARLETR